VGRPKSRGRSQNYVVDIAADNLLVGIETNEATIFRNIHLVFEFLDQAAMARLQSIGKRITQGDQLHPRRSSQHLIGRTTPAATATDEPNPDFSTPGVYRGDFSQSRGDRGANYSGRVLEEMPTRVRSLRFVFIHVNPPDLK
jgi:hypothetical protein